MQAFSVGLSGSLWALFGKGVMVLGGMGWALAWRLLFFFFSVLWQSSRIWAWALHGMAWSGMGHSSCLGRVV